MITLALLLLATYSGPMRCGDLLVAPGTTTLEVRSKCGDPDWQERVSGDDQPLEETWIYSRPGSGEQKLLHFKGARLESLRNAGVASAPADASGLYRCRDGVLQTGSTKLDVRTACGQPDETRRISGENETRRESWLYMIDGKAIELQFAGVELQAVRQR